MKDKIIQILTENLSLTQEELIRALGITEIEEYRELNNLLIELVNNYEVYVTKREKYMLFENSHFKKGKIDVTKSGNGFLLQADGDIFISNGNLNNAMDGDLVIVEEVKSTGKKVEGKVIKVLVRANNEMVGTVYAENASLMIKPADKKINAKLIIVPNKNKGAVDGDIVRCRQISIDKGKISVEVIEIVANHNDPDKDMLMIMAKHNIESVFNDEVVAEASNIPDAVDPKDIPSRRDLREELIFTIDGDDTKDIDDAISLKWDDKGYQLGVHIADVAHYVKSGTAIDETAMNRGTSVYLVDRVVPMLPKVLSNGICSLNPNVDRLAMSVLINLDLDGNVLDYEIFESIINSKKQCTYNNVNKILEENIIPDDYQLLAETIIKMNELAVKLKKKLDARGYIEFESDEVKFKLDENGKIIDIIKREQHAGEKLIENYMILANECIASFLRDQKMPSIYRIHELPSPEKIKEFIGYISLLGYQTINALKNKDQYSSHDVQSLMKSIKDKPEFSVLSDLLLRSMKKAIYSTENNGHFGLGSVCYTHFTSPIRRYPDTTIHRLLKLVLNSEEVDKTVLLKKLVYISELASEKEQASVDCEREVDDMKMAEYMEDHIGEEFMGMIVSVHPFGMFIQLENLIEGLVSISNMDGYYTYVEENKMLVNNKNHTKYRLGDMLKVKCINASKETREIDFEVVKDEEKQKKI